MFTTPVAINGYSRTFSMDAKRSERSAVSSLSDEREKEKSKPEEEEKRPGDLAVA